MNLADYTTADLITERDIINKEILARLKEQKNEEADLLILEVIKEKGSITEQEVREILEDFVEQEIPF